MENTVTEKARRKVVNETKRKNDYYNDPSEFLKLAHFARMVSFVFPIAAHSDRL